MQITVKSAKVGKTGTNKNGAWELIVVTSEDGTDYTTFHKSAKNLAPGTVIDIGEPVIKEGKISFKEYTVVSAPPNGGQTTSGMTPEMWADKDKRERWSIESQVAFKGIVELAKGLALNDKSPLPNSKLHEAYNAALDWALAHFKSTQQTTPKPAQAATTKTTTPKEDELFPEEKIEATGDTPKTIQELLAWVAGHGKGYSPTWIVNKCKIPEQKLRDDPVGSYQEIKTLMGW